MPVGPFEEIVERLTAEIADTTVWIFPFAPRPNDAVFRQVAIVPTKFKCAPPSRLNTGSQNDVLFTEQLIVEVHHHSDDFYDACELRVRMANVIKRVMGADSTPLEGFYDLGGTDEEPMFYWTAAAVLVQRYVWNINIPRIDGVYFAQVKQIDVVDRTQITPAIDGVLTPDDTQEIK